MTSNIRFPTSGLTRGYLSLGVFVATVGIALAVEHLPLFRLPVFGVLYLGFTTLTVLLAAVFLLQALWKGPHSHRLWALPGLIVVSLYLAIALEGP